MKKEDNRYAMQLQVAVRNYILNVGNRTAYIHIKITDDRAFNY